MSEEKGHFGAAALDRLHEQHRKDGTEGGACLTGHQASFAKKNGKVTCNYRYQAYQQADSHGGIKGKLHSYETKIIARAIKTSAWKKNKPEYCSYLPKPRAGDWHVGGPLLGPVTRKTFTASNTVTIPKTMNFTQETWPYWNNAHHLIPKGTLKGKILDETSQVAELIQKALMTAQYNINHKINMLLMPQDKRVADLLDLPRHIQLRDNDAPGVPAICGNHPDYNLMSCEVERGLNSIIKNYRNLCNKAINAVKGTHKIPKPTLDKKKLESLSRKLLRIILGASATGLITKGQSLDAMARAM
jgi:A nuclease family of the HNH/ENDO VII superfamily with conserved AHH